MEFLQALGSSTMGLYRAGLSAFQTFYGKPLKQFLDAVDEDLRKPRRERERVARNTLSRFVEWLVDKGFAPKTVRAYAASVQSLARYYEIPISMRYVRMPSSNPISLKFPWTIDKVAEFIDQIEDPQLKSLAATLFQSGLSVSDALALTYGDIKLEFEPGVTPLCLDIVRKKTNVHFMTFIGEWAVSLLKKHLEGKANLKPENMLYQVSHRTINHQFEKIGRRFAGEYKGQNPCRPHSLRAAFRTILADHNVDRIYIEFWMGHKLPEQEATYVSKSREGWRETYRKNAEPWLTPKNWKI